MRVARFRERAYAFVIDIAIVAAVTWALGAPVLVGAALLTIYTLSSLMLFSGRTPGKIALRLSVVNREGSPPAPWQCVLRPFFYIGEMALFFGGFLVALFSRERLTLHDLALGTKVMREGRPRRSAQARRRRPRAPRSGRGGRRRGSR